MVRKAKALEFEGIMGAYGDAAYMGSKVIGQYIGAILLHFLKVQNSIHSTESDMAEANVFSGDRSGPCGAGECNWTDAKSRYPKIFLAQSSLIVSREA